MKQKKSIIKHIPNSITICRIIGTICLLFMEPFSPTFFVVYTLCGVSDILDGATARLLHVSSELGAKLDSIADLLYYGVMLVKIFPVMWVTLPKITWWILGIVIIIRLAGYGVAAYKYHRMASLHTNLNKLSSAMTFFIPYFIKKKGGIVYCLIICGIVFIAAVQELWIHLHSDTYKSNMKAFGK